MISIDHQLNEDDVIPAGIAGIQATWMWTAQAFLGSGFRRSVVL